MENKLIIKGSEYNGELVGDSVYYLEGNNAMKYENGKITTVYKYKSPIGLDEYAVRNIKVYNENLLKYGLGSSSNAFFVANGKRVGEKDAQTLLERYDVKMKSGVVKVFYESDSQKQYIETYSE